MTKRFRNYLKNSSFFATTLFNNYCMEDYLYSSIMCDENLNIAYNYVKNDLQNNRNTNNLITEFSNGNLNDYNLYYFHKATKGLFEKFSPEELKEITFNTYFSYKKSINSVVKVHVASVPTNYIIKICRKELYDYYINLIGYLRGWNDKFREEHIKDMEEYMKDLELIEKKKSDYHLQYQNAKKDSNEKKLSGEKYKEYSDLEKKCRNKIKCSENWIGKYNSEDNYLINLWNYILNNEKNLDFQDISNKIKDYVEYDMYNFRISEIVKEKFKFTSNEKFYIDSDITKIAFLEDGSANIKNEKDSDYAYLEYTYNNEKGHYFFATKEIGENKYLCQNAELDVLLKDKKSVNSALNAIKSLIEKEPLFYVKISQKRDRYGVRNNDGIYTLLVYNHFEKNYMIDKKPKYDLINNAFLKEINLYSIEKINDPFSDYFSNLSGLFAGIESLVNVDFSDYKFKNPVSCYKSFSGCKNLKSVNLSYYSMDIIKAASMFSGCEKLEYIFLNGAKFYEKIKDYSNMFANCKSLKGVPFLWKMSFFYAENLSGLFKNCCNLEEVEHISCFHAKNINEMFYGCENLEEILDVFISGCECTGNNREISAINTFTGCKNLLKNNKENILNINDILTFYEKIFSYSSRVIVSEKAYDYYKKLIRLNSYNFDKYLNDKDMVIKDNNGKTVPVGILYNDKLKKMIQNGSLIHNL